jgi:predicted peptidase
MMILLTAAVLLSAYFYKTKLSPLYEGSVTADTDTIVENPRIDAPVEAYTPLFSRKKYEIHDGNHKRRLTYFWFAPKQPFPLGRKIPLVVVLHGAPGKAYAAEYLVPDEMQRDFPSFIVVPQSPIAKKWAMPELFSGQEFSGSQLANYTYQPKLESLPDVVELINRLTREFPIDSSRVYIVGCSDGGTGVYGAVLRYPNMFAGAVAISGAWSFLDAGKMTQVPLWIEHGTNDNTFPALIPRVMADSIQKQGKIVHYTEFSNMGHECPNPSLYTRPLWEWLFSQRKG